MWAYIFFLIHLDNTKPNDYTALDLYVSDLVSQTLFRNLSTGIDGTFCYSLEQPWNVGVDFWVL